MATLLNATNFFSFLLVVNSIVVFGSENVENAIESKSNKPVSTRTVTVHTCCPLNLTSGRPERCKKPSPGNDVTPSTNFSFLSHWMAEKTEHLFWIKSKKAPCVDSNVDTVYLSVQPNEDNGAFFLRNGYFKVESHYYHMDEYCINGINSETLEVLVCPQDCKGSRPCIRKCCGLEHVFSFGWTKGKHPKGCFPPGSEYFNPQFYADFKQEQSSPGLLAPHYIVHSPRSFKYQCHENKTTLFVYPNVSQIIHNFVGQNFTGHRFRIRDDGMILYKQSDGKCGIVDPQEINICVDGVMNYGPDHSFSNLDEEKVLFLCSLPPSDDTFQYGGHLYGGLMIFSSLFLALTVIVYIMLWERHTVHGWTILSHTVSLFFMYIMLGTAHILRVVENAHGLLNTKICFAVGLLCHFFFLSTFCWLTMISIDLWLTFRSITPRRGVNSKGFKRYTMYSALAWGIPLIVVSVGWALSNQHPEETCGTLIVPGYGVQNCYVQDKALGIYVYYPIAFLLSINIFFFTVTSVKLYKYKESTKLATKDDSQQQFYRLFFKLFFVMGILYIFEVISWMCSGTGFFWYWMLFDILNILRAVAVFIIFVCKSDMLWALEQNYPWLKPILLPFACITRERRSFSRRNESESMGLNSSLSTKQSTVRSTSRSTFRSDNK